MTDEDDDRPLRIRLPPLRLPPLRLPEGFRFVIPVAGRVGSSGNALLAALALDLIDAVVVVAVDWDVPRVAAGTVLAVVLAGPVGLGYAWEALPGLAGHSLLAVVPSATLLLLLSRYRYRSD